ncbi:protease modulator HflC [Desulfatiferula olefinivorans]
MKVSGIIVVLIAVLAAGALFSMYTVDETQQVVITRFGKVEGDAVKEAGLHFKVPFIDLVNRYPKNLLEWDGERGEIPTKNKTYIWVDAFARWRIEDPILFLKNCENLRRAIALIGDIIDPSIKNAIASYDLIESVRNTNREFDHEITEIEPVSGKMETEPINYNISMGRSKITEQILAQAKDKLKIYGIDLVDVKIKRINYRDDVQRSVYDRMIAERTQIVEKFRSEGRGEAQKIKGDKEKELKRITSEAYKKAQMLKGEADARVTKIYADAYGKDPEFYSFIKALDIYNQSMDKDSTLVLSTDSDFLKYLNSRR